MAETVDNKEKSLLRIVITYDVATAEFSLTGCDASPVVALGVLDYALARVRRVLTMGDMQREMQNLPRVALAGGLPI